VPLPPVASGWIRSALTCVWRAKVYHPTLMLPDPVPANFRGGVGRDAGAVQDLEA